MMKVKSFFDDWTLFEKVWLISFVLIGFGISIAWGDTWLGFISTITGMLCNLLVAKGRISNYIFGVIAVASYGYIAYGYGLYGESMLNLLFYLPANIIGFFLWKKHKKAKENQINGEDIPTKKLNLKGWLIVVLVFIVGAISYGLLLTNLNAQQVRLDSMAVVLSIIAQILMLMRYTEQWILWIIVNSLTIILWVVTLVQSGGNDWTMVVMWSAYLINAIYGYINWLKISKNVIIKEK